MAGKNQIDLGKHSEAKVNLYGRYLAIYLNVLSRAKNIDKLFLFDLFCGEGIYDNKRKGSPIVAVESIKNHYFSNQKTCPNISILFNDLGKSRIEPGKLKIERVASFVKEIFIPENVQIEYRNSDFEQILSDSVFPTLERISQRERALIFIDPWGYKEVKPKDLKEILKNRFTEVLLFLPLSFMHRFANKSWEESFNGGKPLRDFLFELFGDKQPEFSTIKSFIHSIKSQLHEYVGVNYIDTFEIQRDSSNTYCLFFFANNIKGFQKMLEAKWKEDESEGRGFRLEETLTLFSKSEIMDYPSLLETFFRSNDNKATNMQLLEFGLRNNFLPKHTQAVLKSWKKNGRISILPLDGMVARGFYLDDQSRLVSILLR
ncbi:MAG: three-Cys-motif partner protein TcmP [Bacteroidia bacterium]|nr:three-Cys-motif partner protein TcmP [Bacteroidia bacterium]